MHSPGKTCTWSKDSPPWKDSTFYPEIISSLSVIQLECKEPWSTWKELCPALGKRDLEKKKNYLFFFKEHLKNNCWQIITAFYKPHKCLAVAAALWWGTIKRERHFWKEIAVTQMTLLAAVVLCNYGQCRPTNCRFWAWSDAQWTQGKAF